MMQRVCAFLLFLALSEHVVLSAPCDIFATAGTPCVAAHSTTRALYSKYTGPLYTVARASDNATINITVLPSGFADAAAQDVFCNVSAPSTLPPLGSVVRLQPVELSDYSFRHCDAQGFVTPDGPDPDHSFTLVAALNGDAGAVSFRSVNFPTYFIAPIVGAEPGRVGIVEKPPASDASWVAAPAGDGTFSLANAGRSGSFLSAGSNITGSCAGNYAPPSASVYLDAAPTAWSVNTRDGSCVITRLFDQSERGNHLDPAPPGGAVPRPDKPVIANAFPVTIGGGHRVYGAFFEGGMGYRRDKTNGVATGDDPETIYTVVSGERTNDGCCFDYGNAEVDNHDDGAGTMECVYFGTWNATRSGWCGGTGDGPWVMADLEDGLWACEKGDSINPLVISQTAEFVTGLVKGKPGLWAIKAGNATGGPLVKTFEGPRPAGYAPMRKQGSILVGVGGDNSDSATGVWFEGVLTAGYSDDATDDSIQEDITSVYGGG